jgi:MFS family permease
MQNVAAAWLMTSLSPSPLFAALVQTAGTLPLFLFALPAGAYADLVDRRKVLLWTQSAMLLAALALGLLTVAGLTGPWTLLILTFAMGIGAAWNAPAYSATIPELVDREDLPSAVTLNSVQFNAARAVGPALGGLLLLAARPGFVFLFNAASFLVVIDLLRRWRADSPSQRASKDQAQKLWPFIAEGLRFVGQDARMQMVLWRAGCFVIGGSAVWALLPSVAKRLIGTTGAGFGLMFGALGLGAVLAGVLLAAGRHSTSERVLMILGTLGFAVTTGGLPFCGGNLHVSIPLLLLGGMSWMTMMSTLNVAAQSALPDELRARGLSIYIVLFNGAMAFGSWMWGQAADRFPLPDVLFTACAGLLVSLTGVLLQKGR